MLPPVSIGTVTRTLQDFRLKGTHVINLSLAIELLLNILFVTLHGYLAAKLAVMMLFRPRQPVRLFGITIFPQGMIPRHRARLAETIGRAVGEELVSQETITNALFETDFFKRKVEIFVTSYTDELLGRAYPSLLDALPSAVRAPVLDSVSALQHSIADHIEALLRSDEMTVAVERFAHNRVDDLLSRRLRDALDEQAFDAFINFLTETQHNLTGNKEFEQRVRTFLSARLDDLLTSRATLAEIVTPDAVAILKARIDAQLPPIVQQLAELATSERTRQSIGALIIREVDDYYNQLSFIKKIFISRERIYGEVDELVNSTLPRRIGEYLHGEAFEDQAQVFLNSTIDALLARPLADLVGQISPDKLDLLKDQIATRIVHLAQSPEVANAITAYAREALDRLRPHTLRALLEHTRPDSADALKDFIARYLLDVLRRPETARTLNHILSAQIERLLVQPIGRPTDYVSADSLRRTSEALTERITLAARERLPTAITEFDIGGIVRQKVSDYPIEKLETLVLSVAGQHLRKIEFAGLVIGFALGLGQALYILVRFGLRG